MRAWCLLFASCYAGLPDPPAENGRAQIELTPVDDELHCAGEEEVRYEPPLEVLETEGIGCASDERYCFRLAPDLRAAAGDPRTALARAAEAFERGDPVRGRAFADLAVTGAASWAAFAADPPRSGHPRALARAYRVAWALRGPAPHRARARSGLGWIAVSPEDDPPDRPVNVPSSRFPVSDVTVIGVRTRVAIASTIAIAEPPMPSDIEGVLPAALPLTIPGGDVLLLVHGHGSLAEEGDELAAALLAQYRARGADVTIVLPDLPSNGYAARIDPETIVEGDESVLLFLDAFLRALGDEVGGFDAVLGGSLGGNLAMRMAEAGEEWPRRAVAWSPVSIDYSWSHARLVAGDGEFHDIVKHEAVRLTRDASREEEDASSREDYFTAGYLSVRHQASYWYRDGFDPCGDRLIGAGLRHRAEVYDAAYRRWHYRVAYEQLVFSHVDPDDDGVRPFSRIAIPFLLMAGEEDDAMPIATYSFVERLAPHLTAPGRTILWQDTGHAIHRERPLEMASQIAAFLLDHP